MRRLDIMRTNNLLIYISFLICFLSANLNAQIEAPDFLCVKSDTLFWDLPTNTCGPFNAYNIFVSADVAGPYTLLTSITDPTQTSYFHDDPSPMTWYYYLESDHTCPGQTVLSSDILNNLPPEPSPILVVNIVNGNVEVEWEASPSPQVIGYIIFRVTDIGTIPIDTVFTGTTYIDTEIDPNLAPANYYVIALDECGNTSLLEFPHLTVFVESEVSVCEQTVSLNWNLYEGWNNGIERQELWVQINGEMPFVFDTLSPSDTSFIFENIDDATDYCFQIRSFQNGNAVFSVSNQTCFTSDIVQPMRNIVLKNVSVDANNDVLVNWQWDTNAEINTVRVLSSTQNSNYTPADAFPPDNVLSFENNYQDVVTTAGSGPVFYTIQTVDDCDSTARSNYAATIFLEGVADERFNNQLQWTPFESPIGTVRNYELFRVTSNGGAQSIAILEPDELQYADRVDPKLESDANVCYFVVAEVLVAIPGGGEALVFSRSNTTCVEQLSGIMSPNAFAPDGKNKVFKPLLVFGDQVDYVMTIWDRWGQKIFETNDIDEGWTGNRGFAQFPGGAYTFLIKITQPGGRVVMDRGTVILIR